MPHVECRACNESRLLTALVRAGYPRLSLDCKRPLPFSRESRPESRGRTLVDHLFVLAFFFRQNDQPGLDRLVEHLVYGLGVVDLLRPHSLIKPGLALQPLK